jgi:hypothetical protein
VANILGVVLGPIADLAKSWFDGKQKEKQRKDELTAALQQKQLEQISIAQDYAQAFRLAQIQTAGWRPGFWTLVLAAPVVGCFVPGGAEVVQAGFQALSVSTPSWFQYFLGMAISSAFGYQVVDKAYEWWKAP